MKVQLLTRWNGYMSHEVVSVSDSRAEMLESEGIGRIIDRPEPVEEPKVEAPKPEPRAKKK